MKPPPEQPMDGPTYQIERLYETINPSNINDCPKYIKFPTIMLYEK